MTWSKTILNLDSDNDAIASAHWNFADKANYVVASRPLVQANGTRETIYQKLDGDPDWPLSVRIGVYPAPRANDGIGKVNASTKLSTFVEFLDTQTNVTSYFPCNMTLAWEMPGNSCIPDSTMMLHMIQNLVSFMLPLVAGEFDATVLDEMLYGITDAALVVDDPTA